MIRFAAITLVMVFLLGAGLVAGGWIAWGALVYITLFGAAMDRIAAFAAPDHPADEAFPAGTPLSVALALAHPVLLFGGALALAGAGHDRPERIALFLALGLFLGQVSHANAHELIHRGDRRLRGLGIAVYVTLLFGHHASAHPRVHHVWAATPHDPNSARLGEGFWAFARRAWAGSFREGHRAEAALCARARGRRHPYRVYALGALAGLLAVGLSGGAAAVLWYLALCAHAQIQLLLSDYVQHYGLRRRELAPGRWEPVGPEHSWNAPHGFSGGLLMNAPRHSDHHVHPARAYPGLRLDRATMPLLPGPLPAMATLALVPPLWRRVMDPRVRAVSRRAAFREASAPVRLDA